VLEQQCKDQEKIGAERGDHDRQIIAKNNR
jgi:hypothetical protein